MLLGQLLETLDIYPKRTIKEAKLKVLNLTLKDKKIIIKLADRQEYDLRLADIDKTVTINELKQIMKLDYQALQLYNQAILKYFDENDLNDMSNYLSKRLKCVIFWINPDNSVLTATNSKLQSELVGHQLIQKGIEVANQADNTQQFKLIKLLNINVNVHWLSNQYRQIGKVVTINKCDANQRLINLVDSYFVQFIQKMIVVKKETPVANRINYSRNFELALVERTFNSATSKPDLKKYLEREGEKYILAFGIKRQVNEIFLDNFLIQVNHLFANGIYCYFDRKLFLLTVFKKPFSRQTLIQEGLQKLSEKNNISIGVSNGFQNKTGLLAAYHQADLAIANDELHPRLQEFCTIAPAYLAHYLQANHQLALLNPEIELLKRYDSRRRTSYYRTLLTYLLNNFNVTQTAKQLNVHHNTVLYRLEQVKKILNYNLDDPLKNANFYLSLILNQYL